MTDHTSSHVYGDLWCGGDLVGHLPHGRVERVLCNDARHHSVVEGFVGMHRATGEHHVTHHTVPADLVEAADATCVRDDAVGHFRKHHAGAFGRDPYVTDQGALK